jgi:tetratricopeptide (TPR) repeat protein
MSGSDRILAAVNLARMRGDLVGAERECRNVLTAEPANVQANLLLGDVLLAQGRREEAMRYFETAHQLDPMNAAADTRLAMPEPRATVQEGPARIWIYLCFVFVIGAAAVAVYFANRRMSETDTSVVAPIVRSPAPYTPAVPVPPPSFLDKLVAADPDIASKVVSQSVSGDEATITLAAGTMPASPAKSRDELLQLARKGAEMAFLAEPKLLRADISLTGMINGRKDTLVVTHFSRSHMPGPAEKHLESFAMPEWNLALDPAAK